MKRQDRNELPQKLLQLNKSRELNLNIFKNEKKIIIQAIYCSHFLLTCEV